MKIALLAILCLLPSCQFLDGLAQTNPNDSKPVLFSERWVDRQLAKQRQLLIEHQPTRLG